MPTIKTPAQSTAQVRAFQKSVSALMKSGKTGKEAAALVRSGAKIPKPRVLPERMKNQTQPVGLQDRTNARIKEMNSHSSHIQQLGSAYESNTVSSGRQTPYHPTVTAARASAPKGK